MTSDHTASFIAFTATTKWRNAVTLAAVSFAVFHLLAMVTPVLTRALPADGAVFDAQLVHVGAVFCRLVLPFACMACGVSAYFRQRRT